MRKAMQECVCKFIAEEPQSALLLVDIGVWSFHDLLETYPDRAKNIGIFEAGIVSIAAGLSLSGITPTIYGISPFIVQRALEQIKLDFVYQKVEGNFIVTGASYDFSTLGYSHYCIEDIATLKPLQELEIVVPATPKQFTSLWKMCHKNGKATYFRLTDYCNEYDCDCKFGKATIIKKGSKATVVAFAEILDKVIAACKDEDVTILYYSTIVPFDKKTLFYNCEKNKILICSPFYQGSLMAEIVDTFKNQALIIKECSVPNMILHNYGTKEEKDAYCGLTVLNIKKKLLELLEVI